MFPTFGWFLLLASGWSMATTRPSTPSSPDALCGGARPTMAMW
jgi:hypothetical protein